MTGAHVIAILICVALGVSVLVSVYRLVKNARRNKDEHVAGGDRQ